MRNILEVNLDYCYVFGFGADLGGYYERSLIES